MGQHAIALARSRHRELELPRPGVAALPLLLLAGVSLTLVAAPELPWTVGIAVAALFLVAAAGRASQQYLELRRLRATADRLILRDDTRLPKSPFLEWRAEELTAVGRRRALAHSLRHVVHELDATVLPGASPLNRRAVRPYRDQFAELARLVDDPSHEVSARGVLLVESLLTDSASPLYDRDRTDRLAQEVDRAARTLAGQAGPNRRTA
jgi:hypothetical protein